MARILTGTQQPTQLSLPFGNIEIRVIGVGGAGCSSLGRLGNVLSASVGLLGIDAGSGINQLPASAESISLGNGFGSGGDQEVAAELFGDFAEQVSDFVHGADVAIIVTGLGRGTGSGVSPLVANITRQTGALTLAVVNMPFEFEGRSRADLATTALSVLGESSDSVFVLSETALGVSANPDLPLKAVFNKVDSSVALLTGALAATLESSGERFGEISSAFRNPGSVTVGTGISDGLHAGKDAAELAFRQLATQNGANEFSRTDTAVVHVEGGIGMSHGQIAEVVTSVRADIGGRAVLHVSSARQIALGNSVRVSMFLLTGNEIGEWSTSSEAIPPLDTNSVNPGKSVELSIFDTPHPVRKRGPMLLSAG